VITGIAAELADQLETLDADEQRSLAELLARSRHQERGFGLDTLFLVHDFIAPELEREAGSPGIDDKLELTASRFADEDAIALPAPEPLDMTLVDALARRRSNRSYVDGSIPLEAVSALLGHAIGVSSSLNSYGCRDLPLRRVASGGGIETVELVVCARDVCRIDRGVYGYDARAHKLRRTGINEPLMMLARGFGQNPWILEAPLVILMLGRLGRSRWKYGELAYRSLLQDVGNVQANLMLVGTALDLAYCVNSGVDSDEVVHDLGVRPDSDLVLSSMVIGRAGAK